MRKLLNTLYVSSENIFLSLENHNAIATLPDQTVVNRVPLHTIESIVTFSRRGVSAPLMARCSAEGIPIFLMSETGCLLASISMPSQGNVLLRKAQYRISDREEFSSALAAAFIEGKIRNMEHMIKRFLWDHAENPSREKLQDKAPYFDNRIFQGVQRAS